TDRNRPVQVSVLLDLDRHKLLTRHLGHRPEDSLVQPGLANLGGHVFGYHLDCRNHLSSLFLKKFRVHEALVKAAGSSLPAKHASVGFGQLGHGVPRYSSFDGKRGPSITLRTSFKCSAVGVPFRSRISSTTRARHSAWHA